MKQKRWMKPLLAGMAIFMVAAVALATGSLVVAQAASTPPEKAFDAPFGLGRGGAIDRQALLADALGISVEELENAQQAALQNWLDQAVTDGDLTQEQADRFLGRNSPFGRFAHGFGRGGSLADYSTFLAEELGISVDELEAAMQSAHETAIEQLVNEGYLTEEQAEQMREGPLGEGCGQDGGHGFRGKRGFPPNRSPEAEPSDTNTQNA
jgi:polyhydroxyalkanoate synthesis regulator phasin